MAIGLHFRERTMTYNSRLAQELGMWAVTQPGGEKIHDGLLRAYFVDKQNLMMENDLVAVAEQVGLAAIDARAALEERRFREAVDVDGHRCRDVGVIGEPTFVIGNRELVGTPILRATGKTGHVGRRVVP